MADDHNPPAWPVPPVEAALGALTGVSLLAGASALHLTLSGDARTLAALAEQPMFWPLAVGPLIIGALGWIVGARRVEREEAFALYQRASEEHIRDLTESEWVTRAVVQNAFDAVLILSPDGDVLDANPTAARIFGCELEELVERSVDDLLPEHADLDGQSDVVERRTAGGESLGREWRTRARHADGSRFPVDLHISLLADAGLVVYAIREASTRVGEEQRRVREAVDAEKDRTGLERRRRGSLLLDLADHLREHLDRVLAQAEELEAAGESSTQAHEIVDASYEILERLEQLHNLSMWERGAQYPIFAPVEVRPVVEQVIEHARPSARRHRNELVVRIGDDVEVVQSDAPKLATALRNLVSNACRFTEDGTVTVEVIREKGRGTDWVAFYVHDTGPGLDAEALDQLYVTFARMSRGGTSGMQTSGDGGGGGMGLALAQRLARALSGHIAVKSTEGQGSTFSLVIPIDPTRVSQIPDEPLRRIDSPSPAPAAATPE